MGNWDQVVKFQQEYNQGLMVGSSADENSRVVDSIKGRVVQLQEELKKLVTTTISTDMFKGLVSGLTTVFSSINNVVAAFDKFGMSTPLVLGSLTSMFMTIKALGTGATLTNLFNVFKGLSTPIERASNTLTGLNNGISTTTTTIPRVTSATRQATNSLTTLTSTAGRTGGVLRTTSSNVGNLTRSMIATTAKSALTTVGMTLLNGALLTIAGMGITLAVKGLYNLANAHKIAYEEAQNQVETTKSNIKELKNSKSSLSELAEEYDKLSSKTKKTTEESERFAELKNKIAEISPDLQIGTDEDGNAILALNGSLEDYIENLNQAIKRQQELLKTQQNSQAIEAGKEIGKYDTSGTHAGNIVSQDDTTDAFKGSWLDSAGLRDFEKGAEQYTKIVQKRNENIAKLNSDFQEKNAQYEEYASSLQQKAFNKLSDDSKYKNFNKLADDTSTSMNQLLANFDWGNSLVADNVSKQNEFYKGFDEISSEISSLGEKGASKVEAWNKKLQDANYAYQQTGDIDQYKKSIKGVANELESMTGISADEWVTGFTQQLSGSLDEAQISLNDFLQGYGKSIEDLNNGDKVAIKLKAEWEADTSFLEDLTNESQTYETSVDMLVKVNNGELDYGNLSPQIRQMVTGFLDGSDTMSQKELSATMMMSTVIQQQGELSDNSWQLVEKMMSGELTSEEIEIGIELPDGSKLNSDLVKTINQINAEKGNKNIKFGVQIDSKELNSKLGEILNGKGEETIKINIETALKSGDLTAFQEQLSKLPEEKQVKIIQAIQEEGNITSDELLELINGLPPSVQKKINVTTSGASESKKQLDGVDSSSTNKNKKVTISQTGGKETINTENQVDAKAKPTSMKVSISESGGKPTLSVIQNIANWVKNRTQTITTVYKTIGSFGGGSNGGHFTQSKSGFSNVSDTPQGAVSPMSTGFSNVSDNPTTSPVSSPSVPTSNKVSAKSIGSFGTVATTPALTTKITSSYKNLLAMVKYGINLFQELENRISRTGNQLDLLSIKMEDAVGTKKIGYLQTQNKLYGDQAKLQKTLFNSLNNERLAIKGSLKKQGFTFNDQGSLTSYEEQMTKLEKAYDSAKKKEDAYSGKSESTKKKLAKATEAANKKLENAKKLTEEYMDLMNSKIPQAEQEWYELQNAIKETNDEIERLKLEDKLSKFVNDADEATMKIDRLNSLISKLQTKADRSTGDQKIRYLNEEIDLTKQLSKQNDIVLASVRSQRKEYRKKLDDYGFKFDSKTGEMTNYDTVMDKYQNSEDYDKVKQWAEDYIALGESMQDAYTTSTELKYELIDLQNAVKTANLDKSLEPFNNKLDKLNSTIKSIQNNLDILSIKFENAYGTDKLDILKQQIELNEQLLLAEKAQLDALKGKDKNLQNELKGYGFKFDVTGNITNMTDALAKLENTDSYEYVQSVLEQWKGVHEDEIPDAIKSIEEYDAAVKSAYKEQLNTTKEIEDKITDMYKKQLEDKKDAIQKETELVKAEMEKQKKAYQDMRDEADYDNDYEEKTSNISDLQKQLETAKKDNSLGNKKKIADLEKQLADAQKDLDKFVQDKLDQDIMDSYDETAESTEEANNKKLEELESLWSDSKIAEMVAQSLETGLFEGIDGSVTKLEDAMVSFAETSGETFGVMGKVVKEELVANLGIALDTLKNYSEIMNGLGLDKVNASVSTGTINAKSVNTGDITISVTATEGMNEQDLANKIKVAIEDALQGTVQGL